MKNKFGTLTNEQRSFKTLKLVQEKVQDKFGNDKVFKEEKLEIAGGTENTRLKFDFYIEEEKAAIEICLGAIKNEFEKNIFKALLDERVKTLYIMARDYKTSTGINYHGNQTMQSPYYTEIIKWVHKFSDIKVECIPLCPEN